MTKKPFSPNQSVSDFLNKLKKTIKKIKENATRKIEIKHSVYMKGTKNKIKILISY